MSFSLANCKSLDNSIRIIDGDTIILNSEKIRFYGIDTPEKKQKCKDRNGLSYPCGEFATNELKKIISSGQLFCKKKATDRYGRSISICYVNRVDINSLMVKMGMWAGKFIAPWRWRKLKR